MPTPLQVDQGEPDKTTGAERARRGDDCPRKIRLADERMAYLLWYSAWSGSSLEPEPYDLDNIVYIADEGDDVKNDHVKPYEQEHDKPKN